MSASHWRQFAFKSFRLKPASIDMCTTIRAQVEYTQVEYTIPMKACFYTCETLLGIVNSYTCKLLVMLLLLNSIIMGGCGCAFDGNLYLLSVLGANSQVTNSFEWNGGHNITYYKFVFFFSCGDADKHSTLLSRI